MAKKRIVCACGASVASSQTAKYAIIEYLEQNGIKDVDVVCCKFSELDTFQENSNIIVAVAKLYKEYKIPVVNGLCYLTGAGIEKTNKQILDLIKKD